MTDDGQGVGRPPAGGAPPTPGEQQVAPTPPAPPPPPASAAPPPPPPGPAAGPIPPSSFPGADSATMRVMPTYNPVPAAPAPPAHPAAVPAGERHIGKYIVKRELGRGGMGAVYLAEQPGLGREVAIKELILSPAADPTALMRFLQEAQVMARTSHPNLVQVHDLEQIGAA